MLSGFQLFLGTPKPLPAICDRFVMKLQIKYQKVGAKNMLAQSCSDMNRFDSPHRPRRRSGDGLMAFRCGAVGGSCYSEKRKRQEFSSAEYEPSHEKR